jgi:hypothetical protein
MANKSAAGIPHSLVALYDSACRIVWISDPPPPYQRDSVLGREVWVHIPEPNEADRLQAAMLRVLVSLEPQTVDITFPHVGKWRMWLYHVPLNEVRIAEYARRIPPHLTLLTDLEKRICKRLAHGHARQQEHHQRPPVQHRAKIEHRDGRFGKLVWSS